MGSAKDYGRYRELQEASQGKLTRLKASRKFECIHGHKHLSQELVDRCEDRKH